MCYIRWFCIRGLSASRLEPVTRPLLTQQTPEGTRVGKGFSLSCLLSVTGGKDQKWAQEVKHSRRGYGAGESLWRSSESLQGPLCLEDAVRGSGLFPHLPPLHFYNPCTQIIQERVCQTWIEARSKGGDIVCRVINLQSLVLRVLGLVQFRKNYSNPKK